MSNITIYTDGSCLNNPGNGGFAAILIDDKGNKKEISGGAKNTTNNRMELLSVIVALSCIKGNNHNIDIYTDSQYVCNSIEKKWLDGWKKWNWIKSDKKPVLNKDLWIELLPLLYKHNIKFHWIKGHAGHPENERCDSLAKLRASETSKLKNDIDYLK